MEKKYLINLECSINALAELIALGLEKHCTITKLEMFDQPSEEKKPALQVASHKIEFKHPTRIVDPVIEKDVPIPTKKEPIRKISGWDVYEILRENYHPQKTFKTRDINQIALRKGFDQTANSVSAHMTRMNAVSLVHRCGGNKTAGYVYRMSALRNKKDFNKLMASYENKAKAKERKKSAAKNSWFNLAEFQRQYNAN
jgi:hypothetical protein